MADSGARRDVEHEEIYKLEKRLRHLRKFSILIGLVALVSLGAIIAIIINHNISDETSNSDDNKPKTCGQFSGGIPGQRMILGEPGFPDPFHDVTATEIKRVRQYLIDANILKVKPEDAQLSDAYLYTIDLQPPNKTEALNYLDHNGGAPPRYGRVVLFRGDLVPPVVEERLCGPLDSITSCDVDQTAPYAYRPVTSQEYMAYDDHLIATIHQELGDILRESFQGSFDYENCESDCLNYWQAYIQSNTFGEENVRKMWLMPFYNMEYYSLFPLDISLLCNVDGVDPSNFTVEKVWYAGSLFHSVQEFKDAYSQGNITIIRRTHPTEEEASFATMRRKGHVKVKPRKARRPPELIEPDGKRYTVNYRQIDYLDMWKFRFRMSPIYGLSLYDIRFLDERIIYELSLQELGAVYSGSNPMAHHQVFMDSTMSIGGKAKALVPGVDCPNTATFLPITVTSQGREEPTVYKRAVCVFEQNNGVPLRRHYTYLKYEGAFYGGMMDSALVLRSIHAVDNYDYIIDFSFHQNGAITTTVTLSGYLFTVPWSNQEGPYGFQLHDILYGPIHQHLAHFKVDFDVGGSTSNRYETFEIMEKEIFLHETTPPTPFSQIKFKSSLKETERNATYQYEFGRPTHHIIHNNGSKNKYGVKKAYRIVNHSKSKVLFKQGVGPEPSFSWARYQLAVTKRKENEQRSASYLGQFDTANPKVSFENFIKDDENIVDEDLVVWIPLGLHHIPHTEDLPVTSTAGTGHSFLIMPYNYFPLCPSMASTDSVYVSEKDPEKPEEGLHFEFYGTGDVANDYLGGACTHRPFDMTKMWRDDPDELFEMTYNKGVY